MLRLEHERLHRLGAGRRPRGRPLAVHSVGRPRRLRTARIVVAALAIALALASPGPAAAGEAAQEVEERRIEALIDSVSQLGDATFLRNGKPYPASTAAKFLREKWRSRRSEVRSAEDFIARVASFSSTTGKPYLIRFADGREVPSAEYLRAELAKLRAEAP